ncbi:uncharacterized protein LOC128447999 isoform X2 [Pleuronectes platessa]|uniref:uncharacterized protein LOC128447999 isoform X2 n=1 Tax=Pleuronectes platessa TaxID=8262 RepID=UPI00232A1BC1|nr:uncharacterized protein LOC128447999 isoform X2 [Pleuronectes platessa]
MWPKQSTLVLLTVAAMVVSGEQYVILNEEQGKVDIPFGSSLTLGCNLSTKTYNRFRLQWSFNPSGSSAKASNIIASSVKVQNTTLNLSDINWNHTLPNVAMNNSGWYFCGVTGDIPFKELIMSYGTQIAIAKSLMEATVYPSLVTSKQANPDNPEEPQAIHWWMWIVLGGSTFILIVLLVICVMLRRRCRRRREDQIYTNTHPVANKQPSPRPSLPLDTLKTRSSNDDFWTPKSDRVYANGKWKQKK